LGECWISLSLLKFRFDYFFARDGCRVHINALCN
jgi:hypothetical protein